MRGGWVESDVRDEVVETLINYRKKTGIPMRKLIRYTDISAGKFYDWMKRYEIPNKHNGSMPKSHWLFEEEKKAIVKYAKEHFSEGYRRLCYMMTDENVVYASPSNEKN
jgi:predicted DNA-binding transcriptional regulator AlpA